MEVEIRVTFFLKIHNCKYQKGNVDISFILNKKTFNGNVVNRSSKNGEFLEIMFTDSHFKFKL